MSKKLVDLGKVESCKQKNRKQIYDLARKFEALSRGIYPLSDEILPEVFDPNNDPIGFDVDVRKENTLAKPKIRLFLFFFAADSSRISERARRTWPQEEKRNGARTNRRAAQKISGSPLFLSHDPKKNKSATVFFPFSVF